MKTLQNSKAVKLINKLIDDVVQNGIITNTVVEDLKALRPYTIEEQLPLLAKATRLSAESPATAARHWQNESSHRRLR